MTALDLTPAPGAAPLGQMLLRQTKLELVLSLRRGESLLLTLVIPLALLLFFGSTDVLPVQGRAIDFVTPGILALAVTSTAFTGQAIATGFERQYGVLRRLGTTPLPRGVLLGAKTLGVVSVEVLQAVLIAAVGYALGWHPHGSLLGVLALLVIGTVAFSGLGLLLAGALPGLVVLAAANGIYVLLLLISGVVFSLDKLPVALRDIGEATPAGALVHGLRAVLQNGAGVPGRDLLVLVVWGALGLGLAARTFRWDD